ncbi:hypothetical protein V9T40_013549 [Parthenolecanium corni]|uniref:Uncharacterized protein n=1 Tax=Parthenolecanium corni TaxID=536013 RepID=A0AAN9TSB6_9HEMI
MIGRVPTFRRRLAIFRFYYAASAFVSSDHRKPSYRELPNYPYRIVSKLPNDGEKQNLAKKKSGVRQDVANFETISARKSASANQSSQRPDTFSMLSMSHAECESAGPFYSGARNLPVRRSLH